jgi:hypothetical protein
LIIHENVDSFVCPVLGLVLLSNRRRKRRRRRRKKKRRRKRRKGQPSEPPHQDEIEHLHVVGEPVVL